MYHLLLVVFFSFQVLCSSQKPDSAISCVFDTFDQINGIKQIISTYNQRNERTVESSVKFIFYSRENPNGQEVTFNDENSLKECHFDPKIPTKIITHGFNGNGNHDSCVGPTKAFLENGNFNIFIMDWYKHQTEGFWFPIYWEVVKKLNEVGSHLAKMINFLEEHGMNPNTTTLIGHSLGSHVVGIAGYNTRSKVNHIVGLDPAEPFMKNKGPGERISDQDAYHVEIIHTNSNHCGMLKPLGHYDFYPNGGIKQPGCTQNSCSHRRAHDYYTESIYNYKGFYGRRCHDANRIDKKNCNGQIAMMGGTKNSSVLPGVYYVETNSKHPFALGN
ncbi:pancreatic triacylglycerol lipase-like isoform X2 [Copidosoma floridanum]|uniref:pancreatic triacylglycerol lipase-like isoform X2 n=1 Tax=Copidosoma floridanum TaxID=29053 RepID=UPI0006C93D4B|nr:pancreatic triacylglycerol lipase-like isoform X2 [Copidosoma floridanum]